MLAAGFMVFPTTTGLSDDHGSGFKIQCRIEPLEIFHPCKYMQTPVLLEHAILQEHTWGNNYSRAVWNPENNHTAALSKTFPTQHDQTIEVVVNYIIEQLVDTLHCSFYYDGTQQHSLVDSKRNFINSSKHMKIK